MRHLIISLCTLAILLMGSLPVSSSSISLTSEATSHIDVNRPQAQGGNALQAFFPIVSKNYKTTVETANPNASEDAKRVLNWIADLPNRQKNRVISGQQITWKIQNTSGGYSRYVVKLHEITGKWVGMIGVNYGWGCTPSEISTGNQTLIDHWNKGGLITIHHHALNPWTGSDPREDIDQANFIELITPGTAVNRGWMAELDKVAEGLAELRDAGVVVLWRPWQEMSYPQFWWGRKAHPGNSEPFKEMWKHMFNYFTNEKGLNNLLWVYSPADTDKWVSLDFYYPGDAYVDIVGVSVFDTAGTIRWDGYDRLVALGKPVYLTAVGDDSRATAYNTMIEKMQTTQPKLFGFNIWFSTPDHPSWAIVERGEYAKVLLEHPLVITRDEIDWRSEPVPPSSDEFVIDNTDTGFSVNSQDAWKEWIDDDGSNYGDSHHAHREIGTGDTATWSFTVPKPGEYHVYAWWQAAEWRPPDVPYTVNYFGGSKTVRVDQRASGNQWNLLGTFYFQDEGSVMVSDDVSSGWGVVADAIRLVLR